jgi:hypothetical protein
MGACVVMEHQQNDASDMLRSPEERSHDDVVANEEAVLLCSLFRFLSEAFMFD